MHFSGRGVIIKELLGLVEGFASIALLGAGGIGKTAIALTLLHHVQTTASFGDRRYFMRCDDLVNSLDGFLGRLSDSIGALRPKNIGQLRIHLSLSSPCILVLDGVDLILDPLASEAAEIATAIGELSQCQDVLLLATSRMDIKIPGFRRIEVPTLSVDGARDILHNCCSLGGSDAIDELLAELDFHPLSIDLLASVARENDWDEATLLEAWKDDKTNILKVSGRQSLEDNINSILDTPTIQGLGNSALETLEAISAFPGGVRENRLEIMFPGVIGVGEAADALCKFSLVYRQDGFVKMLSPFRFYFMESIHITEPTLVQRDQVEDICCDAYDAQAGVSLFCLVYGYRLIVSEVSPIYAPAFNPSPMYIPGPNKTLLTPRQRASLKEILIRRFQSLKKSECNDSDLL